MLLRLLHNSIQVHERILDFVKIASDSIGLNLFSLLASIKSHRGPCQLLHCKNSRSLFCFIHFLLTEGEINFCAPSARPALNRQLNSITEFLSKSNSKWYWLVSIFYVFDWWLFWGNNFNSDELNFGMKGMKKLPSILIYIVLYWAEARTKFVKLTISASAVKIRLIYVVV